MRASMRRALLPRALAGALLGACAAPALELAGDERGLLESFDRSDPAAWIHGGRGAGGRPDRLELAAASAYAPPLPLAPRDRALARRRGRGLHPGGRPAADRTRVRPPRPVPVLRLRRPPRTSPTSTWRASPTTTPTTSSWWTGRTAAGSPPSPRGASRGGPTAGIACAWSDERARARSASGSTASSSSRLGTRPSVAGASASAPSTTRARCGASGSGHPAACASERRIRSAARELRSHSARRLAALVGTARPSYIRRPPSEPPAARPRGPLRGLRTPRAPPCPRHRLPKFCTRS